jgi:hypothetical protein
VIKIRYADLPEGLHATVEAQGRRTVIYLRPALEPAQRRGALRRVRRMAQIGNGPPLSASGIALAMARDTARSTARNGMAAIRCHPAGSLFLTALLASATVCYMFFVSVSIHLIPAPPARGGADVLLGQRCVRARLGQCCRRRLRRPFRPRAVAACRQPGSAAPVAGSVLVSFARPDGCLTGPLGTERRPRRALRGRRPAGGLPVGARLTRAGPGFLARRRTAGGGSLPGGCQDGR